MWVSTADTANTANTARCAGRRPALPRATLAATSADAEGRRCRGPLGWAELGWAGCIIPCGATSFTMPLKIISSPLPHPSPRWMLPGKVAVAVAGDRRAQARAPRPRPPVICAVQTEIAAVQCGTAGAPIQGASCRAAGWVIWWVHAREGEGVGDMAGSAGCRARGCRARALADPRRRREQDTGARHELCAERAPGLCAERAPGLPRGTLPGTATPRRAGERRGAWMAARDTPKWKRRRAPRQPQRRRRCRPGRAST